jgi:hypothetical protein
LVLPLLPNLTDACLFVIFFDSILAEPQYNIFQGMTRAQYKTMRTLLTGGILSTDLTCHFSMLEKFNTVLENVARLEDEAEQASLSAMTSPINASPTASSTTSLNPGSSAGGSGNNNHPSPAAASGEKKELWMPSDSDRAVIFNVMLHSADISNPCKPWLTSRRWSDALLKEFFHQVCSSALSPPIQTFVLSCVLSCRVM